MSDQKTLMQARAELDTVARESEVPPARIAMSPATGRGRNASPDSADAVLDCPAALSETSEALTAVLAENEHLRDRNEIMARALFDASKRRAEASHLAHHDALTGLPNCRFLRRRMKQRLADAANRGTPLAILLIDLDGFKTVNDSFGHLVGDSLLRVVATRIAACVRADDLACRYGGDEFVVLLDVVESAAALAEIALKVRTHLEWQYRVDGHDVRISVSIGCALYPDHGDNVDALLKSADAEMYRDKGSRLET